MHLQFGEIEFGEMKQNTSNWSNFGMLLRRAGLTASAGLSCLTFIKSSNYIQLLSGVLLFTCIIVCRLFLQLLNCDFESAKKFVGFNPTKHSQYIEILEKFTSSDTFTGCLKL